MEALDRSTDFESGRVGRLFDELAGRVGRLDIDRQETLMRDLKMKDLEETIRAAIAKDSRTHYALAKLAGITPDVLDRFATGERGMNLSTAAKVATVLGLRLVGEPVKKRAK